VPHPVSRLTTVILSIPTKSANSGVVMRLVRRPRPRATSSAGLWAPIKPRCSPVSSLRPRTGAPPWRLDGSLGVLPVRL
jgi:hypothetical protein